MDADTIALLGSAGFAAGAINAVAGGGSLVSFPALVASGLPTLSANVTNTVAVWPGYVGGTVGYRRELANQRQRSISLGITALVGAAIGSVVLLVTDDKVFDLVVPFLVAFSAVLVALQPRAAASVRRRAGTAPSRLGRSTHVTILLAAAYGAYFGGGLGVILLGVLGIFVHDTLQRLNALKSLLSLVINSLALVVFALFGPVDWGSVAIIAPASLLGGFVGARLARRIPASALRGVIVVFGLVVAVWLWL